MIGTFLAIAAAVAFFIFVPVATLLRLAPMIIICAITVVVFAIITSVLFALWTNIDPASDPPSVALWCAIGGIILTRLIVAFVKKGGWDQFRKKIVPSTEIDGTYYYVGEPPSRARTFGRMSFFAPGGLGRLAGLLFYIAVAVALSYIVGPIIRRLAHWVGL